MQKRQFHNYKHFDFCYAENEYKYYDTYLGGEKFPYRALKIYTKGDYHYHCRADGEFVWFQGYVDVFYLNEKIMNVIFMEVRFSSWIL